jgi:hypothetical protein
MKFSDIIFGASLMQIVDSIIALFRVDFTGRGELVENQVTTYFISISTKLDFPMLILIPCREQQKLG